jgi:hypothetical protein
MAIEQSCANQGDLADNTADKDLSRESRRHGHAPLQSYQMKNLLLWEKKLAQKLSPTVLVPLIFGWWDWDRDLAPIGQQEYFQEKGPGSQF